jgi:hypothetical protein
VTRVYNRAKYRRKAPKAVGYHCERKIFSPADWNKKEFGHNWVRMAAYNWASRREEGGSRTSTATARAVSRNRPRNRTVWK